MANNDGPWGGAPRTQTVRWRSVIPFALVAALLLGLWELSRLFPDSVNSDFQKAQLIWLIGVLALVSAGAVTGRRFRRRDTLRNVAIWAGIFTALMIGYVLRDSFAGFATKFREELLPNYPDRSSAHELTLTANEDGGFFAIGSINGTTAKFLVDTGASSIVLSPADAGRAGIDPASLDYHQMFETAHGSGRGAYTVVDRLSVGPIELHKVPVIVNESPMGSSLLGLTFLRQLDSFEVKGNKLTLRWRA